MNKKNDIIVAAATAILAPCVSMGCAFVACYQPVSRCYKQSGDHIVSIKYPDGYNDTFYTECPKDVFNIGNSQSYDVEYRILSNEPIDGDAVLYKKYINYQGYSSITLKDRRIFYTSTDNGLRLFSKIDNNSYLFIGITSEKNKVDDSLLKNDEFIATYIDFDIAVGKIFSIDETKGEKSNYRMAAN